MWTQIRLLIKEQSDLGPTVCRKDFSNHKQTIKQTTIVVTGSLRVKFLSYEESKYNGDSEFYSLFLDYIQWICRAEWI